MDYSSEDSVIVNSEDNQSFNSSSSSSGDNCFSLSSLIAPDFLLVTINGSGVTYTLHDSEIDDFLEITENIQFTTANDEDDISAPGAISITIFLEYNDYTQEITLPYFMYNDVLYVADKTSCQLFSPFLTS